MSKKNAEMQHIGQKNTVRPTYKRRSLIKKIISSIAVISIVLELCSCGNNNNDANNANNINNTAEETALETNSAENTEMTLDLTPFGERSGQYTGEISNGLPNGSGKFESGHVGKLYAKAPQKRRETAVFRLEKFTFQYERV